MSHPRAVLRVDRVEEPLIILVPVPLFTALAGNPVVCRTQIEDALEIRRLDPEDFVYALGQLSEPLLAVPQRRVCLSAFGNVFRDSADPADPPGFIPDRETTIANPPDRPLLRHDPVFDFKLLSRIFVDCFDYTRAVL